MMKIPTIIVIVCAVANLNTLDEVSIRRCCHPFNQNILFNFIAQPLFSTARHYKQKKVFRKTSVVTGFSLFAKQMRLNLSTHYLLIMLQFDV